ncbi:MAG: hypothetical protein A3B16_00405 [Candidatus Zambryskibacteria bacterium RIFCSPLOWO2_01_FULL_45_43]|uniref:Uncharacterized protein n=1 Tax=Candidatus Zambryskibacteria bacterium RIFCSPLOWO2_01_FULL_45_43 TaxID=1802762 RepID=A0A1G2U9Z3_9BACT|nr:MAG: hypothetical protein A3B16_00405 [Candidatus Zambryskibacteria bacterium RIFCSPLOWO2_01_FULL_45_43]
MKKILIIFTILVLAGLAIWYWTKEKDIPLVETIMDGLPFGTAPTPSGVGVPTSGPAGASEETDGLLGGSTAKLVRISDTPVAGMVAFTKNGETLIRYVDRATGHIYDFDPRTREKTKITNQTLPKIYEAHFKSDGNTVLLRYLKNDSDTVENLSLVLTPPKSASTTLYTIASTLLRGYTGPVAINSPFTNWAFSEGNKVVAYMKPASTAPGYAYFVGTVGSLSKILGPLNGLVATINTAGNRVLYSYIEDGVTKLFSKNLTSGSVSEVLPETLADKCVWSVKETGVIFCGAPGGGVGGNEPENWYRGATSFSDNAWKLEVDTEIAQILVEPKSYIGVDIDIYQPKLSPNEDYLVFINKNDLSLWTLKLE